MNPKKSRTIIKALVLTFVFLALTACKDQSPPPEDLIVSKPTPTPAPWENPVYPKDIREEVYGELETFSTPRIQFMAKVWDNERKDIWSMRMDGSDRRRVVAWQNVFNGDFFSSPKRSPNNRYIALVLGGEKSGVGIYDLKQKKSIRVTDGSGVPMFNWTPDSDNLIFHADSKIYSYKEL